MNCSSSYFINEILSKRSSCCCFLETQYSSITGQDEEYVMAIDTSKSAVFMQATDFMTKYNMAEAIWYNGSVVADKTGTFNGNTIITSSGIVRISLPPSITVTLSNSREHEQAGIIIKDHNAKCECGAHKVNSNSHSSWCPIKQ